MGRISFGGQYALVGTSADAAIATEEELAKLKEEIAGTIPLMESLKQDFHFGIILTIILMKDICFYLPIMKV